MGVHFIKKIKFSIYEQLVKLLPVSMKKFIGKTHFLKPLRDLFFRPNKLPDIAEGKVRFFSAEFYFSAPCQIFLKAKKHGIETIISRLILSHCHKGSMGIDVGANYGYLSTIMSLAVKPQGRVFAFEADPDIYKTLQKNICKNKLENICKVFPYRIVGTAQSVLIGERRIAEEKTLDQVCLEHSINKVDFIKVDTDGSDYDVLKGSVEILKRFHPLLVVEMVSHQAEIHEFLLKIGYQFIMDMQGNKLTPPISIRPPNLIAWSKSIKIPSIQDLSCQ